MLKTNERELEENDNVRQPLIRKQSIFLTILTKAKEKLKSVYNSNSSHDYVVNINRRDLHPEGETNLISTSKYTWYNCFPKILIEQFSKMANIYFLIIAIMQSIHEISISAGKPVILLPLSVVIFVNGLKDFFEDWKRKVSDDQENNRKTLIYNIKTSKFEEETWANVKLGDIIKVRKNEPFPADMILINSSEENGLCYKETKNLDGETNLKFRQANARIAEYYRDENTLGTLLGTVSCKQPNEYIYEFDASIKLEPDIGEIILIDKNSFLLRGCYLKQTEFIYGLVVYIGHSTKIMKNSPSARTKTSKIENIMNFQIMIIFCLQIILSLMGAIFYLIWFTNNFSSLNSYIFVGEKNQSSYFLIFLSRIGTWILIFTNLVPISLLVTMEMVKYVQGMFISWDIEIYDVKKRISAKVQTSTLNEELGQVKYIFSDKTGTLTKNNMEFKRMSIGGRIYGDHALHEKINYHLNPAESLKDEFGEITNVSYKENDNMNKLYLDINSPKYGHEIKLFLECLALCHSVIIESKESLQENSYYVQLSSLYPELLVYQASSPDEMCLVNAARFFKYIFKGRDINNQIFLKINGEERTYQLLNILEYSSERKRMSVLVKCPDGKIRLYVKGADSIIRDKITSNKIYLQETEDDLMTFAKDGLRTLMIAFREVSQEEYNLWKNEYLNAMTSENKENILPILFEKLERDLYLLGATAIEDQLQDSVGETLDILIKAGIKVWMLTGDKMDTAKSIAFSCKLVTHEYNILEIPEKINKEQICQHLAKKLKDIENYPNEKYALIINTDEIKTMLEDSVVIEFFYHLAIRCHAVVCCRVSPKQKAQMVNLIKKRDENSTTLAIGDGMNDVNMITSAHIGVGIVGVEGTQAARSSDYSIGEFSFLRKLLLVHGRESYRKNSFIVCYNFYKNVLFVMPQFWFGYVSLYSGQTLYDPWIYQLFNIIFASIPIIIFGIYDKELQYKELYKDPKYYTQGIVGKLFHTIRFWKWVFLGILQGFVLFFFGYWAMNSANSNGNLDDLWSIGSAIYGNIVLVVNLKIFFSTNTHSLLSIVVFILSIISYWVVLFLMSLYYKFENFANFKILVSNFWFFASSLLVVVLIFSVDLGINKILIYYGVVKDGSKIEAHKIDEHLKLNLIQTNLEIEEKMKNKCIHIYLFIYLDGGEAFSQEKGQIPPMLKNLSF